PARRERRGARYLNAIVRAANEVPYRLEAVSLSRAELYDCIGERAVEAAALDLEVDAGCGDESGGRWGRGSSEEIAVKELDAVLVGDREDVAAGGRAHKAEVDPPAAVPLMRGRDDVVTHERRLGVPVGR